MRFLANRLLYHSFDWEVIDDSIDRRYWHEITSTNELVVVAGQPGLLYSPNCKDWILDTHYNGYGIAYSSEHNLFALVGGNFVSTGTITISYLHGNILPLSDFDITTISGKLYHSVAYGNDHFIAVGNDGEIAIYDCNNNSWTSKTITSKNYSQYDLLKVIFNDNKFIAMAQNGTLFTSTDNGNTWTIISKETITSDSVSFRSIDYCNDRYVISAMSKVFTSTDLSTFTKYEFDEQIYCSGYFNNMYILCGGGSYYIRTSRNFEDWVIRKSPKGYYSNIGYFKNKLIVCAYQAVGDSFVATKRIG